MIMNKKIFFHFFLILNIIFLFFNGTKGYSTQYSGVGWGECSIGRIPFLNLNSAFLKENNDFYFSTGVRKTIGLDNFYIVFPFFNNNSAYISVERENNLLKNYETGFFLFNISTFNVGLNFNLISHNSTSFHISSDFLLTLFDKIKWGMKFNNIINIGNGDNDFNFESGILIPFNIISFLPGISYNDGEISFSSGIIMDFDFFTLQFSYIYKNEINFALLFNFYDFYYLMGKFDYDIENKDITYRFQYSQRVNFYKKNKRRVIRKRISKRTLNKQKILINKGLEYYRNKDYEKAYKTWRKAYWLAPSSRYGREAKKYLNRVKNILEQIKE